MRRSQQDFVVGLVSIVAVGGLCVLLLLFGEFSFLFSRSYEIPVQANAAAGLRAGKYKVSISYPDPKGTPAAGDAPGASLDAKNLMPAKYNDQTELRADVSADKPNVFDYDLK